MVSVVSARHTSWKSSRQLVRRKKKRKKKRNAHRGLFLHDLTCLPVTTLGFFFTREAVAGTEHAVHVLSFGSLLVLKWSLSMFGIIVNNRQAALPLAPPETPP